MRARVVDRRWLWPFVGVALFVAACVLLAWWQWDRSQSVSGTARNLAYALEWPSFAGFAVYMLIRAIRLERAESAEDAADSADADDVNADHSATESGPTADAARAVSADAVSVDVTGSADGRAGTPVVPRQQPKVWTARRPSDVADPEPDPDLDQYNQYLAMLNAADEERG